MSRDADLARSLACVRGQSPVTPGRTGYLKDADLRVGRLPALGNELGTKELSHCDMCRVNIAGLDLSGSELEYADLAGAIAAGATFDGSDVSFADFRGANLAGASFTGCVGLETAYFDPGVLDQPGAGK